MKNLLKGPWKVTDSNILMFSTAFYVTTLIVANITAGKLFNFYGVAISVGAFAYMVCLSTSDILVDVYGTQIGYRLIIIGTVMNLVALLFTQLALELPVTIGQEWLQPHFDAVLSSSASVIVASIIGYPITENLEVFLWKKIKDVTQKRHLWLRNTIVAFVSQLVDATIFFSLAFFILPILFYNKPLAPITEWWTVFTGAWLYGLWKGFFLGSLDYPIVKFFVSWIAKHRVADIPELDALVQQEKSQGNW